MKLNQEERTVEQSGFTNQSKGFSIKSSPMAFRILSDKLYSDKLLAIIRELSCNAWDAHKMAGTLDKPFDVHLPNTLEPFFSIRDYGTGLSEENVLNLYTTYFDSTKSDSNEFIGALGLGSKSPFSYVDQFTVESYYNGVHSIYSAYIDQGGTPTIIKLVDQPTLEANGLAIKVMVKSEDFSNFYEKAKQFFYRMPVKPNITGYRLEYETVKYVTDTPIYKIRHLIRTPWGGTQGPTKAYAIQGLVAYPIEADSVFQYDERYTGDSLYSFLSNPLDITFDIGELDITPSRESLSYDKRTIENIKKKLKLIRDEIIKDLQVKISSFPNKWEASKYVCAMSHVNGLSLKGRDLKYKKEELSTEGIKAGVNFRQIPKYHLKMSKPRGYDYTFAHPIIPSDDIIILFNDDNSKNLIYKIKENFVDKSIQIFEIANEKSVLDNFEGCPNVFYLSKLPYPPKASRAKGSKNIKKAYNMRYSGGFLYSDADFSADLNDGGLYVMLRNKKVIQEHEKYSGAIVRFLVGAVAPNVTGFSCSQIKETTIQKVGGWQTFDDYCKSLLVNLLKDKVKLSQLYWRKVFEDSLLYMRMSRMYDAVIMQEVSDKPLLKEIRDKWLEIQNCSYYDFDEFEREIVTKGFAFPENIKKDIDKKVKKVESKYLLLPTLLASPNIQEVEHYLKLTS